MAKSLYTWMAVYHSPHFSSFTEFLDLWPSCYPKLGLSYILGLRPLCFLMR
jgi:hypothetical protein